LSTFEACMFVCRPTVSRSLCSMVIIFRPSSTRVTSLFFDELTNALESLVLLNSTVVVGGDLNIHVEDAADSDAVRLASVFDALDMHAAARLSTDTLPWLHIRLDSLVFRLQRRRVVCRPFGYYIRPQCDYVQFAIQTPFHNTTCARGPQLAHDRPGGVSASDY